MEMGTTTAGKVSQLHLCTQPPSHPALGTDTAFGKITIPPLRLPLPCQLGIVTEILLPRYIDFFFNYFFVFKNLFSISSSMLFSAVGGYNLPLFQFSTALRLGIATASPFVCMFLCHPALWLMEKPRHSILSPHISLEVKIPYPPSPVSVGTGHGLQFLKPSHALGDTESPGSFYLSSFCFSPLLFLGNRDRHIQLHTHSSLGRGEWVEGVVSSLATQGT